MGLLARMRRQYAVYWAPMTTPAPDGMPRYCGPIEIKCRWEDYVVQFIDYRGRASISRARIYADRALLPGGMLFRGDIGTLTSSDPNKNTGAYEILSVGSLPNLRVTDSLREVLL